MAQLTPKEQQKQYMYRDARFTNQYDDIWKSVGKCVFCDLREKYVFFEEHGIVMTVSLYAYIDGHFMIVPRRHIRSSKELTQIEWDTIRKFTYIAKKLIKDVHGVRGMQLVQKNGSDAQSTVDQHLHFHCIPFDAPDLCQWNYRKLRYTPLENADLYKQASKKIIKLDQKFTEKYSSPQSTRVVCDAVIRNEKGEILFQERKPHMRLVPDYLTLPGGGVDRFDVRLEVELAREVLEETGLDITDKPLQLLDSRPGMVTHSHTEPHLHATFPIESHFLWNTYLVDSVPSNTIFTPADDCDAVIWMSIAKALAHTRISAGIREILQKVPKK
jgi:diadenosine tetraphosphate (Ap4A) HIT family hydrolase/8-oxo-dGTP pyrophosphatase MutT (NUDIX family)